MRLLSFVLLLLVAAAPVVEGLQRPRPPVDPGGSSEVRALLDASGWPATLARDSRLSFSSGSAREAREALERGLDVPLLRAFAYLAVGSGGDISDRRALEQVAAEGEALERQAAIFGLGELVPPGTDSLLKIARGGDAGLASCAVLALSRAQEDERAEGAVQAWSTGTGPLSEVARGALAFGAGVATASPGTVFELFLNLRWGAARSYGFVDGMRWQVHLETELAQNEAFLDRVVLGASRSLREGPRRDHLLSIVLGGGTAGRMRGVVSGMPEAFGRLLESGLWTPSGEEWNEILSELESRGVTANDIPLLIAAAARSEASRQAGLLLVAAGVEEGFPLISDDLFAPEPERRLAVAEALGGLADPRRLPDLARLRRDEDGRVRAAAMVALVRLKDQPAVDTLAGLLEGGEGTARSHAIQMLCRASEDQGLHGFLDDVLRLSDIREDERLLAQVSLSLHGRVQPKEALREALDSPAVGTALRQLLVRALGENPDNDDLTRLRNLFPVEDALELNIELAKVLIANRDPGATGILRQALWRGPWNRSVLAAGLLVWSGGIQSLHDELSSPPARVGEEDLRRVGFALGEWGGLTEVEVLARRRRSGDAALQGAFLGALATRTH
ncbi:MAG: HEAT repeat domain-containing protein [Planctomycetota bacterium]